MSLSDLQSQPCPICGQASYTWGRASGEYNLKFQADDAGVWKMLAGPILTGEGVRARKCNGCGNLQLFVEQE